MKLQSQSLSTSLLCCLHVVRFFTGLALLQQEHKASEDTEKEAALFLQQGLEHFVSQRCSKRFACVCVYVCVVEVDAFSETGRECEGMTVSVMYQDVLFKPAGGRIG